MGKRIHDLYFIELQQHTTVNQTRTMYFFFMIAIAINVKINHNLIHATVNGHFHWLSKRFNEIIFVHCTTVIVYLIYLPTLFSQWAQNIYNNVAFEFLSYKISSVSQLNFSDFILMIKYLCSGITGPEFCELKQTLATFWRLSNGFAVASYV